MNVFTVHHQTPIIANNEFIQNKTVSIQRIIIVVFRAVFVLFSCKNVSTWTAVSELKISVKNNNFSLFMAFIYVQYHLLLCWEKAAFWYYME